MKAEAIADYTAALERAPQFVAALTNWGLARLELKQSTLALADFEAALVQAKGTAVLHAGRAIALENLGRHAEADLEFREAFNRVGPGPDLGGASDSSGPTASPWQDDRPTPRRRRSTRFSATTPATPQALYGRAMLAMQDGHLDSALADFNRTLEIDPRFRQARHGRAVVLARLNDHPAPAAMLDWCLEHEPDSSDSVYTAACVTALEAQHSPDPRTIDKALELLKAACWLEPS